jgi:hypothetical protein
MSTSRKNGRVERQQGYAAARAVAEMARKLRGKKLSNKEAQALTHLASQAAGGSAKAARSVTSGGKYKKRRGRRSAIRSETRRAVRSVTGGRKSSRRKSKRSSSRSYGPVPFARQSKKTRKTYLKAWKRKGYKRVARYSEAAPARKSRKSKSRKSKRTFGPVPFARQSKKTRKTYLEQWKRKGYRRTKRYT